MEKADLGIKRFNGGGKPSYKKGTTRSFPTRGPEKEKTTTVGSPSSQPSSSKSCPISSSSQPKSPRGRGPAVGGTGLPEGQKAVIRLNYANQPFSPAQYVQKLSAEASELARRDLPINYHKFTDIPQEKYTKLIGVLDKHFEFANWSNSVDGDYVWDKIKDAWKRNKYQLKRKYVVGKDPAVVKEVAPDGIPLEEWREFVDICHSTEKKRQSKQNSNNRSLQKGPNCSGRTSAQVIRHSIAKELGIPDFQVPRSSIYLRMHTKKKVPQRLDLFERINKSISANPHLQTSIFGDAVVEVLGKDSRGSMKAMGAGVSKTSLKAITPLMKRYEKEAQVIAEWKQQVDDNYADLQSQILQLNRAVQTGSVGRPSMPVGPSSQMQVELNTEVSLFGGCPFQLVAKGRVKEVNPNSRWGERCLEKRNFLIYVDCIVVPQATLPCPHDEWSTTLGQIGQGFVIWPKMCLEFHHHH